MSHRMLTTVPVLVAALAFGACNTSTDDIIADPTAAYVGTWTGTWTNTTFSTSGSASITISVDKVAGTFSITVDLGGSVFGGGDPPAETFTGTFDANGATVTPKTSAVYGDVTGSLNADGTFTVAGANVPVGNVSSFSLTGSRSGTSGTGNVTITFNDQSTASATSTLTKQ